MKVAIIPARGGSKRIRKKNIKSFCGTPIIEYTINTLKRSKLFDHIIVSTDDPDIKSFVESIGVKAPFIRPKNLSNDLIGILPVIEHAVEWLKINEGIEAKYTCCAYATAPLMEKEDISDCFEKLYEEDSDFAVPVTSYDYPIMRALKIIDNNMLKMVYPENIERRSNDFDERYHDTGSFFWIKNKALKENKKVFEAKTSYIYIEKYKALDIDDEGDWKKAELMFKVIKESAE
tara:strand:- start:131 stop:829 length:699 start_codon:yes stop_codon:yes gene_type:complete